LQYSQEYIDDLAPLDAFDIPVIRDALLQLTHQASMATRNRRPLAVPLAWCPEATWQLRAGGYRVLYRVDADVVTILAVRFKGTGTSEDMGP
jgi:mRNA-degrading endonuclease RelE of RelBE toxin-antitoxin system